MRLGSGFFDEVQLNNLAIKKINAHEEQNVELKPSLNHSKKEVQRAGENLIQDDISVTNPDLFSTSMKILSNWRACHAEPLEIVYERLSKVAQKIDKKSITAKRLKRIPSIIKKLRRFNDMKLRNMQDIGGCRAIVSNEKSVYKLLRELNKKRDFRIKDYIKEEKPDGYKGIHLIGKIRSKINNDEFQIEIQLRTTLQHAWATSVEIIDLFTNQALKSNQGSPEWQEFFKLASAAINQSPKQSPASTQEIKKLKFLYTKLNAHKLFEAFSSSLEIMGDFFQKKDEDYHLLIIDTDIKTVEIISFEENQFTLATHQYLEEEKKISQKKTRVVALVSAKSIESLKEAYPNYFGDSKIFIHNLEEKFKEYDTKTMYTKTQLSLDLMSIRHTSNINFPVD